MTPPAHEPHARKHAELGALLQAHVAPGYLAALDMLTRMSETSDFAPDASIYPEARDDEGHRQLEVMAFEIVSQQRRSIATSKAHEMAKRGVRRIFCIDLNTNELLEWTGSWTPRQADFLIEDPCLATPLRVSTVLSATERDNAVAQALHQRGNIYIEQLVESQRGAEQLAVLTSFAEARLGRALVSQERTQLETRCQGEGLEAVRDVILASTADELARWLATPTTPPE